MPTCAGCGKAIVGDYMNALGADWHAACFRCAWCERPIGEAPYVEHDEKAYHADCYHERFSPRCEGCKKPITGSYTKALGKSWHVEHFVCAVCRKPLEGSAFYEQDGKAYCEEDYHRLFSPRCSVCNEPMRGTYSVNLWGNSYCTRHNDELSKCYSCGRLICARLTGGGVKYGDARTVCNLCRSTAVDDSAEGKVKGETLVAGVRKSLAERGMGLGGAIIPLRLVERAELIRLSTHAHASDPSGMACTQLRMRGKQVVGREVEEILVLHGLPREHFSSVVAHELGHAWLFLNAFPELPPLVEEGICELCASLWLTQQDTSEARYRLALMDGNKDPIYGEGFRAARSALEGRTLSELLEYVRQNRRFPGEG